MSLLGGQYEIGDLLGSGAMGDVYRATDSQSGQTVAIKHLKPDLVQRDPDLLERFKREGEAQRDLNHPNIVTLLDVVEDGDNHYLVMEYVAGGDLAALLADSSGGLPVEQALSIAIQLADALTRSHFLDITHRDIKPANVLMAADGTPRLTDFGIAHFGDESMITQTGAVVGTYSYLSPEACMGMPLDARTDIWSFGVVLFEMLTGQRPFEGNAPGAIINAILNNPLPDLQEIDTGISDELNDLLYRMLEKNREARIPSIRLVGAEIEGLLKGIDVTSLTTRRSSRQFSTTPGIPDTESIFGTPAPKTGEVRHNLPAQTTPFVGREAELDALDKLLSDPNTRLITVLGPGGMGKTRLTIETGLQHAATFEQGALFVALDKLDDPENIPIAIADAAKYKFHADGSPKEQILAYLSNKNLLLILDNYEHIISGAGLVSEIMNTAPDLTVIATSREKLNISGENIIVIGGMDFPDWETPADALRYSAVQLFMQSATRTRIDFKLTADNLNYVARVCRLVRGVPLGILLAAAWVDTLTVEEITEEIQESVDFLETEQRDLPERQRSMRAVFDYSWKLLSQNERESLARMAVFRGGCSRKAAQGISGASIRMLTTLANKSLLRRDQETGRFEIHELIRQFAEEELNQMGEVSAIRDAHATYYLEAVAERETALTGHDQIEAADDIEVDFENVRAAWRWAAEQHYETLISNALDAFWHYCLIRSRFMEAAGFFEVLRNHLPPESVLRAHVIVYHENILRLFEERPDAIGVISAALDTLKKSGNRSGEGMALYALGSAQLDILAYEESIKTFEQAAQIFESIGNYVNQAWSLHRMGFAYSMLGDAESGNRFTMQALEIFKELGNLFGMVWANNNLATHLDDAGRREEGLVYHRENYAIGKKLNNKQAIAWAGTETAYALAILGRIDEGRPYLAKALEIIEDINHTDTSGWVMHISAFYSTVNENYEKTLAELEKINALPLTRNDMRNPIPFWQFMIEMETGQIETALERVALFSSRLENSYDQSLGLLCAAVLLDHQDQAEQAAIYLSTALNQPFSDLYKVIPFLNRLRDRIQAALPDEVYQAAVERGQAYSLDEAINKIIEERII